MRLPHEGLNSYTHVGKGKLRRSVPLIKHRKSSLWNSQAKEQFPLDKAPECFPSDLDGGRGQAQGQANQQLKIDTGYSTFG